MDNLELGCCRLSPIERVLGAVDGWGEVQNLEHVPWVCGFCGFSFAAARVYLVLEAFISIRDLQGRRMIRQIGRRWFHIFEILAETSFRRKRGWHRHQQTLAKRDRRYDAPFPHPINAINQSPFPFKVRCVGTPAVSKPPFKS